MMNSPLTASTPGAAELTASTTSVGINDSSNIIEDETSVPNPTGVTCWVWEYFSLVKMVRTEIKNHGKIKRVISCRTDGVCMICENENSKRVVYIDERGNRNAGHLNRHFRRNHHAIWLKRTEEAKPVPVQSGGILDYVQKSPKFVNEYIRHVCLRWAGRMKRATPVGTCARKTKKLPIHTTLFCRSVRFP